MMKSYNDKIKKAAELIRSSRNVYVLTGAGISTESGIPDFRSPGVGLWEKIDPMKESTVDVLMQNPARFYSVAFPRYAKLVNAKPNDGHRALAVMEEMGFIKGIITQNIDNLHKKAGSKNVFEVHGHIRTCRCVNCDSNYPFHLLTDQLKQGIKVPRCPKCDNLLRPNIVLFGDLMPECFFEAQQILKNECDLLMVVGSSLSVEPVASLPVLVKRLIIINKQPTPFDYISDVVINSGAGKTLTDLLNAL
ncbi:MAG: NAD-dependent deacetylase [Thermosediminibacterales bacterium]|nr:NAD-dependent deacetylase [Thermosediminibacterales bacterium]MDK2835488.1 NAD-dependent deacetylase [Thermosediminibacterales bacterium]